MRTLFTRLDHGTRLTIAVVVVIAVALIPPIIALWPNPSNTTETSYPSAVLTEVSYTDCENVTALRSTPGHVSRGPRHRVEVGPGPAIQVLSLLDI